MADVERETEVRFFCGQEKGNFIESAREPETCKYVLTFNTPLLCKHPQFEQEEDRLGEIHCYAFTPDGDLPESSSHYHNYHADQEEEYQV